MSELEVQIGRLQVHELREGDILIVHVLTAVPCAELARLKDTLETHFAGHKVLVLGPDYDLSIVRAGGMKVEQQETA